MQMACRSTVLLVHSLLMLLVFGCGVSSKSDVSASDKLMNGNLVAFLEEQIAQNGGRLVSGIKIGDSDFDFLSPLAVAAPPSLLRRYR